MGAAFLCLFIASFGDDVSCSTSSTEVSYTVCHHLLWDSWLQTVYGYMTGDDCLKLSPFYAVAQEPSHAATHHYAVLYNILIICIHIAE